MQLKVLNHNETTAGKWDSWVNQIEESTYQHTWNWILYTSQFREDAVQSSFVLAENERQAIAICPLGCTVDSATGSKELSLGGNALAAPAIISTKPSMRRQILDEVFDKIRQFASENNVARVRMLTHPLSRGFCTDSFYGCQNAFELQRYQLLADVKNTLIIDLSLSAETLSENLSRYQRRHIRRGAQQGIAVRPFCRDANAAELADYFLQFQRAHFLSAGRMTRPQSTWDTMLARIESGEATLFVAFVGQSAISFLLCCEFSLMAAGWSQANLEEYEREYSPRHSLEWEAILHYKRKGFRFYEVGERYYGPHWTYQPTPKEETISEFKERYGGFMLPKIHWLGYFDKDLLKLELSRNFEALENVPCMPAKAATDA